MRKGFRHILSSVIFLYGVFGLYAQTSSAPAARVISPAEGTWSNKQSLILEVPEDYEVFYSFTGSDPRDFGFAYDGPVMLDATGAVPLRIVTVASDGRTGEQRISYTVAENSAVWEVPLSDVLPFVVYAPGDSIVLPAGFSYSLGTDPSPLISDRPLFLEGGAFPARFVPCMVTNGSLSWRFVIVPDGSIAAAQPVPASDAAAPRPEGSEPPFTITDWTKLTFTRKKLIYSLDGGEWASASGSLHLDRSVSHTVSWQSVAYDPANPVYTIELPPKPAVSSARVKPVNTPAVLSAGGGYDIAPHNSYQRPVPQILVDAFYGELLHTAVTVDVYYGGVYNGTLSYTVSIDKRPPPAPQFVPDSDSFYSRRDVSFTFVPIPDAEILYKAELTSEAVTGFNELAIDILSVPPVLLSDSFSVYTGKRIHLQPRAGIASLFTVTAYSRDTAGNVSAPAVYRVIIDQYNYYIEADSSASKPDGSLARPFSSLEQALPIVNSALFTRLHINGMVSVPESITLTGKCEINGAGTNSGFIFAENASFSIKDNAQVYVNNCVFEKHQTASAPDVKQGAAAAAKPVVSVQNAAVSFSNCEFVAGFVSSGSVFAAESSSLSLDNCGVTVRTGRYTALLSGIRSNITVSGGRFTAIAPTAVLFSLSAGLFNMTGSNCKVIADLGRIAELTGVTAVLKNNIFAAELQGDSAAAARVSPVWHDGRSKLTADDGNTVSGFPGGLF